MKEPNDFPSMKEYQNYIQNRLEVCENKIDTLNKSEKKQGGLTDNQIDELNKLRFEHMDLLNIDLQIKNHPLYRRYV